MCSIVRHILRGQRSLHKKSKIAVFYGERTYKQPDYRNSNTVQRRGLRYINSIRYTHFLLSRNKIIDCVYFIDFSYVGMPAIQPLNMLSATDAVSQATGTSFYSSSSTFPLFPYLAVSVETGVFLCPTHSHSDVMRKVITIVIS